MLSEAIASVVTVELGGAVALVTGGAAGLGAHVVEVLRRRGAEVVVADRSDGVDVTDPVAMAAVVHRAASLGPLRVLINNAGGWLADDLATIELNLLAPLRAIELVAPAMVAAGGGAVVNVSSSAARGDGSYGCPGYAVAKAGLVRYTTAQPRIGPAGEVRVTTVVPGWIGLPRAHREYAALSPAERRASGGLIDPERLAGVIVDLAAHGAGGTVLAVDAEGEPYPLPGIPPAPPVGPG